MKLWEDKRSICKSEKIISMQLRIRRKWITNVRLSKD